MLEAQLDVAREEPAHVAPAQLQMPFEVPVGLPQEAQDRLHDGEEVGAVRRDLHGRRSLSQVGPPPETPGGAPKRPLQRTISRPPVGQSPPERASAPERGRLARLWQLSRFAARDPTTSALRLDRPGCNSAGWPKETNHESSHCTSYLTDRHGLGRRGFRPTLLPAPSAAAEPGLRRSAPTFLRPGL